jgi:dimethylhistidine N-methyltransferase
MSSLSQPCRDISEVDERFLTDVIDGLSQAQKTLPCKYFYDERGSQLFEQICDTVEYYVTRTECAIYEAYAHEMAQLIGERALILEPGAGSVKKISLLLSELDKPAGFIPMDISAEILNESTQVLSQQFADIDITPSVIDFLDDSELQRVFSQLPAQPLVNKRVIFFPGSTIGNFHPDDARAFLQQFADHLQPQDGLLIGVDLVKDAAILESAYNDEAGVTADFNLNVLQRINAELNGEFSLSDFSHQAVFNQEKSRIEMHLVSSEEQQVTVAEQLFSFSKNETIHTENSYKYTIKAFNDLAASAGFTLKRHWQDVDNLFSVYYLEVA